jgi:hypothetical protein
VLQVVDVGMFPPSACAPATARDLRVYPPGSREALDVPLRLRACSKPGPVYLTVTPVGAHVGVPGRP